MEDYTRHYFDSRQYENDKVPASEHHTEDFTLQKSDGTVIKGRDAATKANQEMYAVFAAHHHVPDFFICWETDYGWEMTGVANAYFKLHGLGEGSVTDPEGGKGWHGYCPGSFHFQYVKDDSGKIKLRKSRIFSDSGPALKLMLKNKLLDAEQLAGIVIGS
jgi:hypothetical protein